MKFNTIKLKKMSDEIKTKSYGDNYSEVIASKENIPLAEEGVAPAITSDVNLEKNAASPYGLGNKFTLTYKVFRDDESSVDIKQVYWQSASQKSRFHQVFSELLQKDPNKGFTLKEVLGVTCEVEIVNNKTEKGIFSNVEKVKKVEVEEELDLENITI